MEAEAVPAPIDPPGEVMLYRRFDNKRSILVSEGDFGLFIRAWLRHVALWDKIPDGFATLLVRQGLAAEVLTLANRPRDENIAWTLNLRHPPTNLFLTGSARDSTATGRVFTEDVRVAESSRLFVQTVRPGHEPALSVIDVTGLDVLEIFEQWFARSEQNPARFFELEEDRFVQVRGMPGVNREWLLSIAREDLPGLIAESMLLEERTFRFECGCTPQRMIEALQGVFASNPDDLFLGDDRVEVTCPRCGRRWWVTREHF